MAVALTFVVLSLALSGQWIAAKIGVTAVPALEISTMRFAIASVVLLAASAITRTPLPLGSWRPIAAAAACGVLGFNTLAFVGLSFTPASDIALILPTTIPLATALFSTLIRERLTRRKLVGFAIASAGAAIVIVGGQQAGGEGSSMRLLGDLLEIGGAALWGASLTIGAVVLRRATVLGHVTLLVTFGTLMLFPLGLLQQGYRDLPAWSMTTWAAAGFLGVFSTALAFVLFLWAVGRFGPTLAATVAYFTPVATLVLAAIILQDFPMPLQIAGATVILVGVRVAASGGRGVATERLAPA